MGGRLGRDHTSPLPAGRTLYGFIDRQNLDGLFRTFDFASPDASSPRRVVTTVPQQALFLMNSPFVIDQARRLAGRAELSEGTAEARVARLYEPFSAGSRTARAGPGGRVSSRRQEESGPSLPPPPWSYGYAGVDSATWAAAAGRVPPAAPLVGLVLAVQPGIPPPRGRLCQLEGGRRPHRPRPRPRGRPPLDGPARPDRPGRGRSDHPTRDGDGVRGLVVSSRDGVVGDWVSRRARVPTPSRTWS